MPRGVRHNATVQVKRGPRKVKSSFSLRAPCVTSSRVNDDNGVPVAWQRLVRPRRRKRGRGRDSIHSFVSPSPLFSLFSQPSPRPFLPTVWLYSLAPLDSSPSGGRHLNWTAAIAVVCPPPPACRSERGREPEKARSSLRIPFSFGAASFRGCYRRRRVQPSGIACKRL